MNLGPRGGLLTRKKTHGSSTSAKFGGIQWSLEGRKVPESAIDKIQVLKEPANKAEAQNLIQGCQTHFYWGPHQPHSCLQRAKIILGLYKCNYSLTVMELKLHSAI